LTQLFQPALPSLATWTQYWRVLTNDSMWWADGFAAHYPYIANSKYPRVVHPLDAPFLVAFLHDVLQRCGADPKHLFVVGFSSGAMMAAELAQVTSVPIAGVGISRFGWRPYTAP
jgi:acetyl esterase/lipase